MRPLESSFFFKFLRYFFLIYLSLVFLYWLIDSFEKSLRLASGQSLFFSDYAFSTVLVIAINQLHNALFAAACCWLYEFHVLNRLESAQILNLSLLRLLRPLFFFIFFLQLFHFYLNEKQLPFLMIKQVVQKEALHFKKKRSSVQWLSFSDHCFARERNNEIDLIYKEGDGSEGGVAFFHKERGWMLSRGISFFKKEVVSDISSFLWGESNSASFKKKGEALFLNKSVTIDRKSFFFRTLQIYALFVWFWYSVIFALPFWLVFIFWHFIYYFCSFLGIFLASYFLWYDFIYLPVWIWSLGLCFLIWRVHRGNKRRGRFYGDHY